ncbi:MAG: SLC13 family permease, partial [Nitrospinota bacterium]
FVICAGAALAVALVPAYPGLSPAGRWALFILVFAAELWITEAIPAFAVALLVIGLEIAILGRPGGPFATSPKQWEIFVRPWSSPLIWLFFGGFVLAEGATKTRVDRWLARMVLKRFGQRPDQVLMGVMTVTFSLSMFMSNTATTAMMIAIIGSMVASLSADDPFAKALLLGVPFSANLGGMATLIGTPPNAIAAGALAWTTPISFPRWIMIGLPPSLVLAGVLWLYLRRMIPSGTEGVDLSAFRVDADTANGEPFWRRAVVILVFLLTAGLWLTGPLHKIPTPVVSFIPITVFAVTGVLDADDVRSLHWDVLLLMTGGLSLGVAVAETGLAKWIVEFLPTEGLGPFGIALGLAYLAVIISNFVSNTAVANLLVPIALPIAAGIEARIVVPVALAASTAMCFAISTPPNAIAFSTGKLTARDLLMGGAILGILGPLLVVAWSALVL